MSKSKQTAVDWLIEALGEFFPHGVGGIELVVKQAKEIHKQEIENAWKMGRYDSDEIVMSEKFYIKQYYNKTFGGKDEQQ